MRAKPGAAVAATSKAWLAAKGGLGDTAASCSTAVAARRIQWVNTPVLIEAMERQRQGRLPRSLELWLGDVLELPACEASTPVQRAAHPSD